MSVELFLDLSNIWVIVCSRARVLSWRELLVFDVNGRFEYFTNGLRSLEVTDWCSLFSNLRVWIVQGWTDCIMASSGVHILIDFLARNGRRLRNRFVHRLFMLVAVVFGSRFVQFRRLTREFQALKVGSWPWVCQVGRGLVTAGAWGSWAETRDLHSLLDAWPTLLTFVLNELDIMSLTVPTTFTFSAA